MAINFTCDCGQQMKTSDEYVGMTVRCPHCSRTMKVPSALGDPPKQEKHATTQARSGGEAAPRTERSERSQSDGPTEDRGEAPRRRVDSKTSGLAVLTLVLGIASFIGSCLFGVPALLAGIWALISISKSEGSLGGKGMAIAGLILGIVGSLCSSSMGGIGYLGYRRITLSSDQAKSNNNLRQIGIAMQNYESRNTQFPAAVTYDQAGKPLLSWRVAILPDLGEDALYRSFALNQPWDSATNLPLLERMPKVYAAPRGRGNAKPGYTFYRVFYKQDNNMFDFTSPIFVKNQRSSWATIADGSFNTAMVVEAATAVPWTKPEEIPYPPIGTYDSQMGGIFGDSYQILFADGTVSRYKKGQMSEYDLKAMITANGGEVFIRW